ncbi:MAG: glycosyltransferase family 4 protein [Bacteroidetes bacterium]|nr:glycosyltransferase family 4 protein [Bacteroidota bacterium]
MRKQLLIVTDKYPVDPGRSPTAWLLEHLRSLEGIADVTVVSLLRMLPRVKNLILGGYDRRWFRILRALPAVEQPFPHVTVYHRHCLTVPDRLGWKWNPALFVLQQQRWLRKLLHRSRFDAVLVHYLHAATPLARNGARSAGIPLWLDENEGLEALEAEGQARLRRWLLRQLSSSDIVLTQCSRQERELSGLLPHIRVHVIPPGAGDELPAGDIPPPPPFRLLCVSRLDQPGKNVAMLLHAIARLRHEEHLDVRLTIAGDGYQRRALQRMLHTLDIEDIVRFTGWLSSGALRELRREHHCAVQPSEHESFGLAALEAVAAGLPLIACADAGVVSDLLAEGAAVQTMHLCTEKQLVVAIRTACERLPELQRQAVEARGRLRERFSWSAHAEYYAALLGAEDLSVADPSVTGSGKEHSRDAGRR